MKSVSVVLRTLSMNFLTLLVKGHVSNRGKSVIDLSTVEVPAPSATRNDIIFDSDGKMDSVCYI